MKIGHLGLTVPDSRTNVDPLCETSIPAARSVCDAFIAHIKHPWDLSRFLIKSSFTQQVINTTRLATTIVTGNRPLRTECNR
jgi:hypothetical protein